MLLFISTLKMHIISLASFINIRRTIFAKSGLNFKVQYGRESCSFTRLQALCFNRLFNARNLTVNGRRVPKFRILHVFQTDMSTRNTNPKIRTLVVYHPPRKKRFARLCHSRRRVASRQVVQTNQQWVTAIVCMYNTRRYINCIVHIALNERLSTIPPQPPHPTISIYR
jgi:hypothetical protein